jgi:hypothetical protein
LKVKNLSGQQKRLSLAIILSTALTYWFWMNLRITWI